LVERLVTVRTDLVLVKSDEEQIAQVVMMEVQR
jgi:hypothetical protein